MASPGPLGPGPRFPDHPRPLNFPRNPMNDAIPGEVVRRSDAGPGLGDRGNIRGAFRER